MEEKNLIYCVDDEEAIREVYKFALEGAGFSVFTFQGAVELFSALNERVPDLIILDVMLDGLNGLEILNKLKESGKTAGVPVIMVSAKTTETDRVKGLNLGADDYLCKPFGVLELIARVNAKLRAAKTPAKNRFKDLEINEETYSVFLNGEPLKLTLKQYELLKLLVRKAETVVPRDECLDDVWGENYGETRTLDMHVAELRKALRSSAATIETVRGIGYVLK